MRSKKEQFLLNQLETLKKYALTRDAKIGEIAGVAEWTLDSYELMENKEQVVQMRDITISPTAFPGQLRAEMTLSNGAKIAFPCELVSD